MRRHGQVIIFLGPPGSGKGTQAGRLSAELGIPAISTGDMLRRECQSGSSLGKSVKSVLDSGQLVSDDLINQVVASRLGQHDCEQGCILDGYPRTISQARFLNRLLRKLDLPKPVVFDFQIDCEQVVARLSRRRHCAECGRTFTVSSEGQDVFCDRDGAKLVRRSDDDPQTIRERLNLYQQNAGELVRYYAAQNYQRMSAAGRPEDISAALLRTLEPAQVHVSRPEVLARPQYQAQTA